MKRFTYLGSGLVVLAALSVALAQQRGRQPDQEQQRDRQPDQERGAPRGPDERGAMRADFQRPMHPLMVALDTNRDAELSAEEIQKAPEALRTLDKNQDGMLSREELEPPRRFGFGGDLWERIQEYDENGDGLVSLDELPERMQRIVERVDTNGDGAIDEAEAKAFDERARERGPRGERGADDRPGRERRP